MATISLCIIAKNEEARIGNCLSSVSDIVDEIIIVDTGSTDNTKKVCRRYTDKIFDFEWKIDFSAARNFSFSKATGDWILWLDCDDIMAEDDRIKLLELKKTLDDTDVDVFCMTYNYRYDEIGNCIFKVMRERLVRNFKGYYWDYPIHEKLVVSGKQVETDICVTHTQNHDNGEKYISFFETKIREQNYQLRKRDMYYFGGELCVFGYFDRAKEIFEEFFSQGEHDNLYESKRAAEYLYDIYLRKEMYLEALEYEFKYLKYGTSNAKLFSKIGFTMNKLGRKEEAILYYKAVVDLRTAFPKESYVEEEFVDSIFEAALELVCLLYSENKIEEAREYHLLCRKLKPQHKSVVYNNKFFSR